ATSSKQPIRVSYSNYYSVRFDGVNDWMQSGAIAALNSNNHTHFVVYNGNQPDHAGMLFEGSFSQSNQFIRTFRTSDGNIKSWVLNNSLGIVSNTAANSSAFQIIHNSWDKTGDTFSTYKNGTLVGTQTGATGNPTGNYAN